MQKLIRWFNNNWLFVAGLLLLAFIPLYPKIPLFDIKNTWVYVRLEDFFVLFILLAFAGMLIRGKITLKSPLTAPIFLFFLAGGVATIHSIVLIYPTVSDIFPNVSFLSYLRRIEYMSVFFISYAAMKDRRMFPFVVATLTVTVITVSLYGLGQKYAGFPAFLTMNEEFAKGLPIQLSALSRVSSTFGGHYDLAAFLVLTVPVCIALTLGLTKAAPRFLFAAVSLLATVVMFMTVSRISFAALVFVVFGLLLVIRRKLLLILVPLAIVAGIVVLSRQPGMVNRFSSTVKTIDVLVDAKTGSPLGHVEMVPNTYFRDKTVLQQFYKSLTEINIKASPSAKYVMPYVTLSDTVILLREPMAPTGEDLPSGSGYINLTLSPNIIKTGEFMYEPKPAEATASSIVHVINGEYLVKRTAAYDLSFTTRFQGEWPKALLAFRRNILFGSGYGSVSLAVDNSYLRMLGETGILGSLAFLSIFLVFGAYLVQGIRILTNPLVKYVSYGLVAGIAGLCINALFIDVFEASKVAFTLWLLMGFVLGAIRLYSRMQFSVFTQLKSIASSNVAIVVAVAVVAIMLFVQQTRNYFVGDDYTWLRWAATCTIDQAGTPCTDGFTAFVRYISQADGFFYRPGTKLYFWGMYRFFWLNPEIYHAVSLGLHALFGILVYFLARIVFSRKAHAALSAFLFVMLSASSESVIWISATGHLIAANFVLASMLLYIAWSKQKRIVLYCIASAASFFAMMFHEFGIVAPFLFLVYVYTLEEKKLSVRALFSRFSNIALFIPLIVYLAMRFSAGSHWFSGDYNYNLLKFPLNAVGNYIGYAMVTFTGPMGMAVQQFIRASFRENTLGLIAGSIVGVFLMYGSIRLMYRKLSRNDRKIILFSLAFSVISLLPFLGLGNITLRYHYVGAAGFVFFLVYILRKLYAIVLTSGRETAMMLTAVAVAVFTLWHVVVLQGIHLDWYHAGEKTRQFIISIDNAYENYWATEPMRLHFVNVPIRHGEAWVFPVGIEDALWFVCKNPDIQVYSWDSRERALDAVPYGSPTQKVFEFSKEGKVWEVQKKLPEPVLLQ